MYLPENILGVTNVSEIGYAVFFSLSTFSKLKAKLMATLDALSIHVAIGSILEVNLPYYRLVERKEKIEPRMSYLLIFLRLKSKWPHIDPLPRRFFKSRS